MDYSLDFNRFMNQQPNALDYIEWNYRKMMACIEEKRWDSAAAAGMHAREACVWAKEIMKGEFHIKGNK